MQATIGTAPFSESIEYFRSKVDISTEHWDDLQGEMHAKAFTIAGATKAELRNDIRAAIAAGLTEGETLAGFRKRFDQIVQQHGWQYKGNRNWRTRIIYDTNIRTAHAAGRWQQMQRTKDRRPYLEYLTVGDSRVRPQHQAWHGTVLHIDDPWWDTHYPPNGWGCRCRVRTLSARQMEREGKQLSQPPPLNMTERVNTRTGEVYGDVPAGIDTGWSYNVGKAWLAPETAFGKQMVGLPPDLRSQALSSLTATAGTEISNSWKTWAKSTLASTKAGSVHLAGHLSEPVIKFLQDKGTALQTTTIIARDRRLRRMTRDSKAARNQALDAQDILSIADHLQHPQAILWDVAKGGLLYVFNPANQDDARLGKVIVRVNVNHLGEVQHEIWSGGLVAEANLKDANQYQPIEGQL